MKNYFKPEIEVIYINYKDIIMTSGMPRYSSSDIDGKPTIIANSENALKYEYAKYINRKRAKSHSNYLDFKDRQKNTPKHVNTLKEDYDFRHRNDKKF